MLFVTSRLKKLVLMQVNKNIPWKVILSVETSRVSLTDMPSRGGKRCSKCIDINETRTNDMYR